VDPNTSYTDITVAPGTTYYYAATAVSSSGQESAFSAPVEIAVP
jgi:fibronectin type 3 domain-containing protein